MKLSSRSCPRELIFVVKMASFTPLCSMGRFSRAPSKYKPERSWNGIPLYFAISYRCYNFRSTMTKTTPEETALAPEILAKYEPVIGLEVHVQLLTNTKIFCACANRFGDAPNTNVCPVCLGLPGTLPILNKRVVEMASLASLALHCTVHERSRFARKN